MIHLYSLIASFHRIMSNYHKRKMERWHEKERKLRQGHHTKQKE